MNDGLTPTSRGGFCHGLDDLASTQQAIIVTVFSFHLAKTNVLTSVNAFVRPLNSKIVSGLHHAECMAIMTLGSSILSPKRMQLGRLAMFAAWEDEQAIDRFLGETQLGQTLENGWHVRLEFLRRWGLISEFEQFTKEENNTALPTDPVVAVTLARLKLTQVPRFIHWGKPVETLVRDHPSKTIALAAMWPPRTISTFSIWNSQQEMTDMVHGHSPVPERERHSVAMVERDRKDFHLEFTTLRFRPMSEHGTWEGEGNYVPRKAQSSTSS